MIVFCGGIFRDLVTCTPRFPKPGETLFGSDFFMGFGGKSANQAVMCGRLGGAVAMVGKMGDDDHGRAYMAHFQANGVDTSHLHLVENATTGIATILVNTQSGENEIVIVSGANTHLGPDDVIRADQDLFARAGSVVCAMEAHADAVVAALEQGRKYDARTILNVAPAPADGRLDPRLLPLVDVLCVNETEADLLTGRGMVEADNGTVAEAKRVCAKLLELGLPTVIVTVGAKGAVVATQAKPGPVHVQLETETPISVVDTTGAGDAFVGALAYFMEHHRNLKLEDAVRRSCAIATITVQKRGTQSSYPMKEDVPPHLLD